ESLLTESSDTIPEQTSLDELKASATEVSQDLFSGKWQRTNCVTGDFATVTIRQNDDNTANVSGFFYDYGNVGSINNATGYYIGDNKLFVLDEDYETLYLFSIEDGNMKIIQHGAGNMGDDVTSIGDYTQDEPQYTDADVIENNFTDEQIETIKTMLDEGGLDYTDCFENTLLYGVLTVSKSTATFADGSIQTGTYYEAVAPHGFTYDSYTFIADDGEIYYISTAEDVTEFIFLTTNDSVTQMPEIEKE
ncbi:MAG: hypothetical protein K6A23_14630, partial [Butyrivibrio sp.]|nr:hypothetical protein [Butyrivibrio sp.]